MFNTKKAEETFRSYLSQIGIIVLLTIALIVWTDLPISWPIAFVPAGLLSVVYLPYIAFLQVKGRR